LFSFIHPKYFSSFFLLRFSKQGVASAAVNVICELARKNPKNYLPLAPQLFKLLNDSSNNWMLIKIVKLVSFSSLPFLPLCLSLL